MPGDNCSVYGCGISRRKKDASIFKIPGKKKVEWRSKFLNAITKTRETNSEFREMIKHDRVFACSRHFHQSEIKVRKYCLIYFRQGKLTVKSKLMYATAW